MDQEAVNVAVPALPAQLPETTCMELRVSEVAATFKFPVIKTVEGFISFVVMVSRTCSPEIVLPVLCTAPELKQLRPAKAAEPFK